MASLPTVENAGAERTLRKGVEMKKEGGSDQTRYGKRMPNRPIDRRTSLREKIYERREGVMSLGWPRFNVITRIEEATASLSLSGSISKDSSFKRIG
ncbi:hypothetical protein TNCT_672981 [Trichonephila clavata]|uniref:Uncharacterized protein n=1 Tax=Trichonephila clavata TaxID=2740835 RepID=A0A8X6F3N1_TRICU|nr:hypothetical protein TNCT_672981 [Trichonephila clavata]